MSPAPPRRARRQPCLPAVTPFTIARRRCRRRPRRALPGSSDIRLKTAVGWTALCYAAASDHEEAIHVLVSVMDEWISKEQADGDDHELMLAERDAARVAAIRVARDHGQGRSVAVLESLAELHLHPHSGAPQRRSSSSAQTPMGELSPRSWAKKATQANRRGSFISRIVNRRGSRDAGLVMPPLPKPGALQAVATFARRMSRDIL